MAGPWSQPLQKPLKMGRSETLELWEIPPLRTWCVWWCVWWYVLVSYYAVFGIGFWLIREFLSLYLHTATSNPMFRCGLYGAVIYWLHSNFCDGWLSWYNIAESSPQESPSKGRRLRWGERKFTVILFRYDPDNIISIEQQDQHSLKGVPSENGKGTSQLIHWCWSVGQGILVTKCYSHDEILFYFNFLLKYPWVNYMTIVIW